MTPEERSMLQVAGTSIWKNLQINLPNFLLYGIFSPLTLITIHSLVTHRGLSSTGTKATVGVILFSFLAATGAIISSLAANLGPLAGLSQPNVANMPLEDILNDINNFLNPWASCLNWFQSLPPIVNDALIIWRAWIIFSGRRWAKFILAAMWITSAGTMLSGLIIDSNVTLEPSGNEPVLFHVSAELATASTALSFATNLLATTLIAYILRAHMKLIKSQKFEPGLQGKFRVWQVLMLLMDTGFVYCGLQLIDFIITVIPTAVTSTFYQNGAIFNVAYLGISAFYPTIVTYLVHGLSTTVGIHQAATVIHESQQRERSAEV